MGMEDVKRFASRELPVIIDRFRAALVESVKACPGIYAMATALAALFLASAVAASLALPSQGDLERRVEKLEEAVFGDGSHEIHVGER